MSTTFLNFWMEEQRQQWPPNKGDNQLVEDKVLPVEEGQTLSQNIWNGLCAIPHKSVSK